MFVKFLIGEAYIHRMSLHLRPAQFKFVSVFRDVDRSLTIRLAGRWEVILSPR
jgi:hypothetical protein